MEEKENVPEIGDNKIDVNKGEDLKVEVTSIEV